MQEKALADLIRVGPQAKASSQDHSKAYEINFYVYSIFIFPGLHTGTTSNVLLPRINKQTEALMSAIVFFSVFIDASNGAATTITIANQLAHQISSVNNPAHF